MTLATAQPNTAATPARVQRHFEPHAPVGNVGGLKGLLEAQKISIGQMLPKHISPERLFKTFLVAANRNPQILQCTQLSILETVNRAAELGLDLSGTLGEAYPVPFNNKVKVDGRESWEMQCTLIIGYRGMEKLAWQSGEVDSIDAEVVYTNDSFTFKKGTEVLVEWSPCLTGERGEVIGAYACVKMKSGGKLARFLTKSDIEKIRNSAKSKDSPAWRNWWDEMARKCVLKRTLKDAPLSTEKFVKAMEIDAEDHTLTDVFQVTRDDGSQPRSQRLLGKLQERQGNGGNDAHDEVSEAPETSTPEPEPAAGGTDRSPSSSAPVSGTESLDTDTGEVVEKEDPTLEDLATWISLSNWAVGHYARYHHVEKTDVLKGLEKWVAKHLRAKDPKMGSKLRGDLAVAILEERLDLATGEVGEKVAG